jgi:uncharacterized membrane protein
MKLEMHADIDRPPQQVFAFLANAENMPRWRTDLDEVEQITEGPPQRGTRFRFVRQKPHIESTAEWVEFEQDRKLSWQGAPASIGLATMQFSGEHNVLPREGGTHLRCIFVTRFGGAGKVIGPFLKRSVRRELEDNFQTLKQIVESEPEPAAPPVPPESPPAG